MALTALGLVGVGAITGTLGVAPATAADGDYPSWNDVQQAKGNARAAQAEVDRITGLLAGLQAKADAAGRASQIAAERALRAQAAAASARSHVATLSSAERAAAKTAALSRMRAGLLAAHLARSADGDLSTQLLLDAGDASNLLARLSSMQQLSAEAQAIQNAAVADDRTVSAMRDQVRAASAALDAQQRAADAAAAQAKSTAQQAADAVRSQQATADRLTAQLADLRSTSTRVAAEYAQGVAAQRAAQQAASAGSGSGSGSSSGSSGGSGGSGGTTTAAPNASLAARAVAYARDQIGDPYVFAAAGPNAWDCSGLTMMAYESVGIDIGGHSATAQYDQARAQGQLVPYGDARAGDLVFYTDGGGDMYHVAIYAGGGMMIEAPYEGVDVREVPVRSYQLMPVVARPTV